MFLKTLTLRGFKSFASATTLRFEPGITCVVGPNGSGKSNIVDAFCWVMGEQGVKPLRGGKMDDIVFAGTSARPPLGRAEVTLTIDNSDGALPIDYAEVTISRLLFRSGQSEYAINGDHCRLLDVQELLSDSGLGREMHVIVGQGNLEQVLAAGPEDRRALIEEAAGVLKHRRRKEKALRKLDAMQANLTRLVDLTTELGRRLKPLGRQAQIAKRAARIQAELRDARLRLLADDYVTLRDELERDADDEAAAAAAKSRIEAELAAARAAEAELEEAQRQHAPRLAAAGQTYFALGGLSERLRGVLRLAAERHRHLSEAEPPRVGRDPGELELQAAALRDQEHELGQELVAAQAHLATAITSRQQAEDDLARLERQLAADAQAAARHAERLARLRGQVAAAASRAAAAEEEAGRLDEALAGARARAEQAQLSYAAMQDMAGGSDADRTELTAGHERAGARLAEATAEVVRMRAAEHAASDTRAGLRARAAALAEAAMRGTDGLELLLARPGEFPGVLGPLADELTISDGAHEAIAAALGAAANAVAVDGVEAAAAVLEALRDRAGGRVSLIIGSNGVRPGTGRAGHPVPGGQSQARVVPLARELVNGPERFAAALDELLAGVYVVADLTEGMALLRSEPAARVVTRDGDLIGSHWARGGSAAEPTMLALRAAADQASAQLSEAERAGRHAESRLAAAAEEEAQAQQAVAEAEAALREADAAAAQTSGRLGTLAGAARAAQEEARRLETAITSAERSRGQALAQLEELRSALADETSAAAEIERAADAANGPTDPAAKQRMAHAAVATRNAEMEARLEVRTVEERLRAISGRADALASAAVAERQSAAWARAREQRRTAAAAVAAAVADGAAKAVEAITASCSAAQAERDEAERASQERDAVRDELRDKISRLSAELEQVSEGAHGAALATATKRIQLDQVLARAADSYAVDAPTLAAEYGPDVPVPVTGGEEAGAALGGAADAVVGDTVNGDTVDADAVVGDTVNGARTMPYNRDEQERRAKTAQRQLDQLGKVNPLALEEFAAQQERHAFLVAQLEDLRKTRRDLLTVIREVDERVEEVFAGAFADTAREFEAIFARLFPGGEGRLSLTDPDDMLGTGIEIEARPPGKKVRRLSLLSGGERALTAIAFVLAIFKARPSPFYVLDEVEAALDDTNLGRLLEIFAELGESSQLIIATHQRRTMEVADILYGISMRGDGVSSVISQRIREVQAALAGLPAASVARPRALVCQTGASWLRT